jgi:hypothetical protein
MLDQSYKLRQVGSILSLFTFYFLIWSYQPIALFVTSADEMYGPITTLRHNNRLVKHIPWSAFKMTDNDWNRVVDARDILAVRFLFSYFSIFFSLCHMACGDVAMRVAHPVFHHHHKYVSFFFFFLLILNLGFFFYV